MPASVIDGIVMLIEMAFKALFEYVLTPEGQAQLDKVLTAVGLPDIIPGDPTPTPETKAVTPKSRPIA